MTKLMYIKGSPRGERSHSLAVADAFLQEYLANHPDTEVLVRDLYEMDLPAFDGETIQGKYNIMHGQEFTASQKQAWSAVERVIEDFAQADVYLFAVPMWNFNLPYRLKHLIDLLSQPGYTFSAGPEGYQGLLKDKKAFVAYARGGEYPKEKAMYNHQGPYFKFWLSFVGITDVVEVAAEGMLGPEAKANHDKAVEEARQAAKTF